MINYHNVKLVFLHQRHKIQINDMNIRLCIINTRISQIIKHVNMDCT
jgi:hypothetical protein